MPIKLGPPQDYQISCSGQSYNLSKDSKYKKFSAPASSPKTGKLYAVYDKTCLHYIGVTRQSMSSRLNYGFKASGKNGYHGYKWKDRGLLNLSVWALSCGEGIEAEKMLQTIEAEIAFLYRREFDKWPESQNEIHFYNGSQEHRDLAQGIFDYIKAKLNGHLTPA